jgi:hypothetical protein
MIWAEVGCSAWDMSIMSSTRDKLQYQADFSSQFYKMMNASGCDGVFFWWYPGGFRTGEDSDYGIINPDGSDRAVSKVIRENALAFINGPDAKPVDTWITFDRDRYPVGIGGVYDAVKVRFWAAADKGLTPGLRTSGTGTNSNTCALTAVGNTRYNGSNPLKYMDAAFDLVEVRGRDGRWKPVKSGDSVDVAGNRPLNVRFTVTNLGEATWLPSGVCIASSTGARWKIESELRRGCTVTRTLQLPGNESSGTLVFSFEVPGRASFGEKFRLSTNHR